MSCLFCAVAIQFEMVVSFCESSWEQFRQTSGSLCSNCWKSGLEVLARCLAVDCSPSKEPFAVAFGENIQTNISKQSQTQHLSTQQQHCQHQHRQQNRHQRRRHQQQQAPTPRPAGASSALRLLYLNLNTIY